VLCNAFIQVILVLVLNLDQECYVYKSSILIDQQDISDKSLSSLETGKDLRDRAGAKKPMSRW
jgi:hypothetical protein